MDKKTLKSTVIHAPKSLKDARFIADTLKLQIDNQFTGRTVIKYKELENGFALLMPMKVDGVSKWCAVYRWTKSEIGVQLDFDDRVVSMNIIPGFRS